MEGETDSKRSNSHAAVGRTNESSSWALLARDGCAVLVVRGRAVEVVDRSDRFIIEEEPFAATMKQARSARHAR
jgi:hypothetical protein